LLSRTAGRGHCPQRDRGCNVSSRSANAGTSPIFKTSEEPFPQAGLSVEMGIGHLTAIAG
jgi:hypothetical protein